jgi:hypothetical protein
MGARTRRVVVPAQAFIAQWLDSFKEFPVDKNPQADEVDGATGS